MSQCIRLETATQTPDPRQTSAANARARFPLRLLAEEEEQKEREAAFAGYQVTPELMDLADKDGIFMHCLPAHRGEEVSAEMMDDPRSVVFDEAENRLHAQKALMETLLLASR